MLKQQLLQKVQHKLSPQQIKLLKLIQLSTLDFEQKVKQELEENPALEETESENFLSEESLKQENDIDIIENDKNNSSISEIDEYEYSNDNKITDINNYYNNRQNDIVINNSSNNNCYASKNVYIPTIISGTSFQDYLKSQLYTFRFLKKEDLLISDFILGSIDDDGYIRRKVTSISDDIHLILGISVNEKKIEDIIINYIQKLDPTGVGARNLQECLLIQLERKKSSKEILIAKKIIKNYFDNFLKKHYQKLQNKLQLTKKNLRNVISKIEKLNPKPGKIYSGNTNNTNNFNEIIPDFTISIINGQLELSLNQINTPELKISPYYLKMLDFHKNIKKYEKNDIIFIKQKIDSAKWFVEAIKQRKNTLIITMNAIMNYQKEYFLTGDPYKIKPMILKNISEKIGVGISTVSRVANSKYVNTPYGTFLVKSFFSEKMINKEGEEISSIEIKKLLGESIAKENKKKPLTDEKLSKILQKKGYMVARRTVSKYRDQMHIPIARMRKTL
ncbi:RNA polymerase factor sigma-54 [Blattabacterium cuenoti]|uniref:RNA polymerase factor sigma-54 n=1 Tax=Blattabacterium cuenoti TaxID=1653831 RepID=UPI00163BEFBD|nr:RNA polymerase factor sigma-54 [Blattabacterium cuenoti]